MPPMIRAVSPADDDRVVAARTTGSRGPTVSVVMPVRNVERYVGQALRSLVRQTLGDIEIIVVDDGSSDRTLEQVRGVGDPRIRVVPGRGHGVSAARNCGIRAARGEYVAFMDGDDTCDPERLERQVAVLAADDGLAGVGTSYRAIDAEGRRVADVPHLADPRDLEAAMYSFNPFCGASLMFRRDVLTGIGGYRESLRLGEDYELCARVLVETRGLLANLPQPLYHYRWHDAGTSSRRRGELADALRTVRDQLWQARPPTDPRRAGAPRTGGRSQHSREDRELRRLRTSAYLQLALGMVRRGRRLGGLHLATRIALLDPRGSLAVLGRRVGVGSAPVREPLRRTVAYASRFLVRHLPPRRRGARVVAAVNRLVPPPHSPLRVRILPDVVLSCNVRDSIGWRIFYRGEYEPALTRLLAHELRVGDTFLDIGANCGYHTLLAARRVGSRGRVHAFEPSAHVADRLARDVLRNGFGERVHIHRVAVGAEPGSAVLGEGSDATSPEGTRHLRRGSDPEDETVEIVALDDYLGDTRVDVVKLDIEGYEELALAGMRRILRESSPRVVVAEAVAPHLARFGSSRAGIIELMGDLGYTPRLLREPGYDDVLVFRRVGSVPGGDRGAGVRHEARGGPASGPPGRAAR